MKFILESVLFLIIMNMIGLLDGRLRAESTENRDLKMQVATYESANHHVAEAIKMQGNQLIALR